MDSGYRENYVFKKDLDYAERAVWSLFFGVVIVEVEQNFLQLSISWQVKR